MKTSKKMFFINPLTISNSSIRCHIITFFHILLTLLPQSYTHTHTIKKIFGGGSPRYVFSWLQLHYLYPYCEKTSLFSSTNFCSISYWYPMYEKGYPLPWVKYVIWTSIFCILTNVAWLLFYKGSLQGGEWSFLGECRSHYGRICKRRGQKECEMPTWTERMDSDSWAEIKVIFQNQPLWCMICLRKMTRHENTKK